MRANQSSEAGGSGGEIRVESGAARVRIPDAAGWWWGRLIGNKKWYRMKVIDGPDGIEVVQQSTTRLGQLAPLSEHVCVEWSGRCAVNGSSPSQSVLANSAPLSGARAQSGAGGGAEPED